MEETKMWRPLEYWEHIITKSREYLDLHCSDKEIDSEEWHKTKLVVRLPSIEWLCLYLKIHRSTCYDWKEKYPEFSDIIEELMQSQAFALLNNWLSGNYNPTIAKVILTKHWYTDKVETKNENTWEITINIVD